MIDACQQCCYSRNHLVTPLQCQNNAPGHHGAPVESPCLIRSTNRLEVTSVVKKISTGAYLLFIEKITAEKKLSGGRKCSSKVFFTSPNLAFVACVGLTLGSLICDELVCIETEQEPNHVPSEVLSEHLHV